MNNPIFTRMLKAAYDEARADFDPYDTGLYKYPFSFEEVKWFFDEFFSLYRVYYGKEHQNIKKPKMVEYIRLLPIVQFIQYPFDDPDGVIPLDIDSYEFMLDRYFSKHYRIPHSLPHFFAGRTRSFLFAEVFM